jgi:hypothetical protein
MVKHIVMWKLKNEALGNSKEENARMIKEKLESLNGKIDGIQKLEVGIDFSLTESSFDVVLYSEFNSRKDLDNYQNNPLHKAVMPFILECRSERKVVDYEV